MNSKIDFGECLNELMLAADLKNSKLAKAINVDASLIYKWINNKSIPPYNSQHIDLIVNQIKKNTINSYQSKNIIAFIKKHLAGCSEINETNMINLLKKLLIESQGYSIEKKKNSKKNSNKIKYNFDNKAFAWNPPYSLESSHFSHYNSFLKTKIIIGYEQISNSILQFLEDASTINCISAEPIIISLLTETSFLSCCSSFNTRWNNALCKLINKGWSIIYLIHINNNTNRNLKIIEKMFIPISSGKYQVYYTSSNSYAMPFEIVFVPMTGALLSVSSVDKRQVDSSFFIRDKDTLNILNGFFHQVLASSKPLLKSCSPINNIVFQKEYSQIEECLGNRYSVIRELNALSIPIIQYEQNLNNSNNSNEEIENILLYRQHRIETFESQIKHYKFRDIIYDQCITNIIEKKKCSYLDKYYTSDGIPITNDDIIKYLSYIIYTLKNHENYEIGLLSKNKISSIPLINWMVKENSAVGIITCAQENQKNHKSDESNNTSRGFIIYESHIVKSYEYYFYNLWNQLKPNKKEIISQFENYIKLLSSN